MKYFILYFILELCISISTFYFFGWTLTFLEIICTFFLGIFIIYNFKSNIFSNFTSMIKNEFSFDKYKSLSLYSLLGALFLIIPGILTDVIGILMQFEAVGLLISAKILAKKNKKGENDVIDVEVIEP